MSKLTILGNVPNTDLSWEKLEWELSFGAGSRLAEMVDYLLVKRNNRRKVIAQLDLGQLVALRASIDTLVAAEAEKAEK